MLRDITLGQYYPVESPIHRLDPRTKLAGTLIFIVSLFLANSWLGYLIAAVFLFACIQISGVPLGYMVKGLRAIIFILLFSVGFNIFLTPGEILVQLGFLKVTKEGLIQAGYMGDPPDFPDYGIFADDLYHNTDFSDGWYGARPSFPECDPCAGA